MDEERPLSRDHGGDGGDGADGADGADGQDGIPGAGPAAARGWGRAPRLEPVPEPLGGLAPGGGPNRWWARPLAVSVTALAAMAVVTLAAVTQSPAARAGSGAAPAADTGRAPASPSPAATTPAAAAPTPTATAPSPTATPSTSPTATPSTSAPKAPATHPATALTAQAAAKSVRDAVDALPGAGDLAVAVADLDAGADGTGAGTAYDTGDADTTYDTASIVKVDILAALLLRDQHAGTRPSAYQRSLATAMIERSDNDAATALWDTVGRAGGLDAANRTLGLRHTQGGRDELWGLTQTTAGDQLTLLRAVFGAGGDSPLTAASRSYVKGLMGSVTAGQRWGVSAADSDDAGYALKNGWLQRTATGLWDINSIGEVAYEGHRLLIAVLSSGQATEAGGIDLVEDAARAVAKAYTS